MWSFYPWFQLPALAGGLLSLGGAYYAWRCRTTPGARPTVVLLLLLTIWSLGSAAEIGATSLAAKCLLVNIEYLGIAYTTVAWLVTVLDYLGYGYHVTVRNIVLLCIIPTAALLLNWTNASHHWFYAHIAIHYAYGMPVLALTYTTGCWIFLGYAYLLCAAGLVLCLQAISDTSPIYRRQAMIIFCCALLPTLTDIAYTTHLPLLGSMELTPLAFTVSAGLILWGIGHYRLLKLAPIAHRMIVESIADGIIVQDAFHHVLEINPTACRMLGLPAQTLLSRGLAALSPEWAALTALASTSVHESTDVTIPDDAQGSVYEVRIMPINAKASGEVGSVILLRDITSHRRLEAQLTEMAFFDSLTGLPNRALFFDRMTQALARNARQNTKTALFYLDLDQFKQINDSFGHAMGDEMLRQVAQRLRTQVRDNDTLARLGGDEFVILLSDIDDNFDANAITSRVLHTFTAPFQLGASAVSMTPSIGVAIAPTDGVDMDHLLSHADHAMYLAKQRAYI